MVVYAEIQDVEQGYEEVDNGEVFKEVDDEEEADTREQV